LSRNRPLQEAPLVEHLEELRNRILKAVVAWFIGTAVAWSFAPQILTILSQPLVPVAQRLGRKLGELLIVQTITESFTTTLSIAAYGGLLLAFPVIAYQVWAFIAPGLYSSERRLAVPFLLGAGFSFAAGALFTFYIILPFAIPFLTGFLGAAATPMLSIGRYIGQVITFMAVMGIVFEMPIVSYLLTRIGLLSSRFLSSNWRIAIVLMIALAAVITPTVDIVNLSLVSGPLIVLFWLSVGVSRLAERARLRAETRAGRVAEG
jgi:sec-independent protein translocase protein TatC